ncbi:pseudouridine synthase [Brevundimonas sp. NPDC003935]|uniref:pseudouridine synthase n=1 Tax=unclassified Brevundimonas TaxID=2622653 RepID=UPI00289A1413|nr:pseudouridine synthase [Brevundimonas sp.]
MDRHPKDNDKKPRSRQDDGPRGPRKFADARPDKGGFGDRKGPPRGDRKDDRGDKPFAKGAGKGGPKTAKEPAAPLRSERIAKAMARAGIASRREVERLIGLGKVAVNGRILDTPATLVTRDDVITVNGKPMGSAQATRVWRYHKPAGLITSHNDPAGRPTVFDALPSGLPRVISVGRLDLNTEGLLLLTNDGELSRALEMPDTALVRHYRARARGRITQEQLDKLKTGCTIDGVHYGPMEATIDKAKEKGEGEKSSANLWISVSITEGKNREVRKVLESVGLTVNRLIRLAYGPFQLGTLPVGAVEEVGPRVIREMLADHIRPENLPTGNTVSTPAPIPGRRTSSPIVTGKSGSAMSDPSRKPSRVRAATEAQANAVDRRERPAKKEGWAKATPKFEHTKTFKPRARPEAAQGGEWSDRPRRPFSREPRSDQFIDDRRAPRDGAKGGFKPREGGFGDRPKRDFKPRDGATRADGDRPQRDFKSREGGFGDRPKRDFQPRDGAPRSGGDRPQRDFKPREGGFSDRPQRDFKPRSGGKPGGFGGKPGGGSRPGGGKPFGGKPSGGRGGPRDRG